MPLMKLTQHLDRVYQLVLDRADPAKVREHIELVRDQVDAADKVEAKLRRQIARDKKSHAKEMVRLKSEQAATIAKFDADNAKMVAQRDSKIAHLERGNKHLESQIRAYSLGHVFRIR